MSNRAQFCLQSEGPFENLLAGSGAGSGASSEVRQTPLNFQKYAVLCFGLLFDGRISACTVGPCPPGYWGAGCDVIFRILIANSYNDFFHFFPLIGTIRTAHTIHRATRRPPSVLHTASNAAKRSSTSGHGLLCVRKPVTLPARFAREVRITRKIQAGYQPYHAATPVRLAPCPKGMVIR